MKSTAILLHAALGALLILPAHGTMDEFLKNSPLGKDRLEAERVLRLDAGSLNNAQSKSGMEVAGNGKLGGVDFIRRVHFSKGKVTGYEWYAEGDPIALEGVWTSVGNALSKAYGASPVVTLPQERLGELSPIGDTSGKLKCWSKPNHALCAFLEISGRKAYLVFGQYDLQAEGIPLLDDTGTSDYLRGLLGKQSGKLPDLWKACEAGVLSPAIEGRAADAGPKGKQSKPGETTEFSPAWNSDAMKMVRERELRMRRFDRDFTAADYVPEAPGRISKHTAWDLNRHAALALEDLERVPDGEKGKGLPDHSLLKQMALDLQAAAVSMNRNELIQLIPRLLALDSMVKEYDEVLWGAKQWIDGNAIHGVIGAIAKEEIVEKQGTVDAAIVEKLALTYCNVRFHPDEELVSQFPETIDASAVFILDPVKVTAILKTRNLRDLAYFMPAMDFESYFRNFDVGGGGLEVLRIRFAANKGLIRQKFDEVAAYRKQLEAPNAD